MIGLDMLRPVTRVIQAPYIAFGPEMVFAKHPPKGQGNLPPSAGYQFFGDVQIEAKSQAMRVVLRDISGAALYTKRLEPSGA